MKALKIDAAFLGIEGACIEGVERFEEIFPNGVTVTDDQHANFRTVLPATIVRPDECCLMCGIGGDIYWLAETLSEHSTDFVDETDAGRNDIFLLCGVLADAVGAHLSRKSKAARS